MRGSLPENVERAGAQSHRAVLTKRTSFLLRRNCTAVIAHRKTGSLVRDARQSGRSKVKSVVALMLKFSAGILDIVG